MHIIPVLYEVLFLFLRRLKDMKISKRNLAVDILLECLGSFLIAIATYNVVLYAGFPMSGFSGIALILYRLTGFPIGWATILLNVPVAFLCYKMIGAKFMFRSLRCMVISSLMVDYVAPLLPVYSGERMLCALAAGVLLGLGFAIIYMRGSSTGGADFIVIAVKARYPHLKLGNIIFAFDFLIVVAAGLIFNDVDGIIYGILINFIMTSAIDRVMYGLNAGKLAFVVTDRGKSICDAVDACCQRGSTMIPVIGGYSGAERQMVMVAGSTKDMYSIEKAVKKADPMAFMIIMESSEVHGFGFSVTRVAE